MRVSQHYKLRRTQATLDFVDVDVRQDTPVFLSPSALSTWVGAWGAESVYLVRNFFSHILSLIKEGENVEAERLLRFLREPKETRLGLAQGSADGHALGDASAHDVWAALSNSKAALSGLLTDLEDTVLFVKYIGIDKISDITTNIIRGPLLRYAQKQAQMHEIPLREGVAVGPLWDPQAKTWVNNRFDWMPIAAGMKLLLVPKAVVRQYLTYDPDEYYRHYLLEHMKGAEEEAGSSLVKLLRDKSYGVTKSDLIKKYGSTKEVIEDQTIIHREALQEYKEAKAKLSNKSLDHDSLARASSTPEPDWDSLLKDVLSLSPGGDDAYKYEKAIEALFSALFYPDLQFAEPQVMVHGGLKIIDIQYANSAQAGFFEWLSKHYSSAFIHVECKNFGK